MSRGSKQQELYNSLKEKGYTFTTGSTSTNKTTSSTGSGSKAASSTGSTSTRGSKQAELDQYIKSKGYSYTTPTNKTAPTSSTTQQQPVAAVTAKRNALRNTFGQMVKKADEDGISYTEIYDRMFGTPATKEAAQDKQNFLTYARDTFDTTEHASTTSYNKDETKNSLWKTLTAPFPGIKNLITGEASSDWNNYKNTDTIDNEISAVKAKIDELPTAEAYTAAQKANKEKHAYWTSKPTETIQAEYDALAEAAGTSTSTWQRILDSSAEKLARLFGSADDSYSGDDMYASMDRSNAMSALDTPLYYDEDGKAVTYETLLAQRKWQDDLKSFQANGEARDNARRQGVAYDASNDSPVSTAYYNLQDVWSTSFNNDYSELVSILNNQPSGADSSAWLDSTGKFRDEHTQQLAERVGTTLGIDLTGHASIDALQMIDKAKKNVINVNGKIINDAGYDYQDIYDALQLEKDKTAYEAQQQEDSAYAQAHPVIATLKGIVTAPAQAIDYAKDVSSLFNDNPYVATNPYDNTITNRTNAYNSAVAQKINDDILRATGSSFAAWAGQTVYSGVTSSVQSYVTMKATSLLFGGGPVGEAIGLAVMSTQAASSTYTQAALSGKNNAQALTYSIAAGINEALFEKISFENLKSIKGFMEGGDWSVKQIAKSIADALPRVGMQGLVEGSEEFFTDIANAIADGVINGNNSDYYDSVAHYVLAGYTQQEAEKLATVDFTQQLLESFIGGMIGGLTSGGTQLAVNTTTSAAARGANVGARGINAATNKIYETATLNNVGTAAAETGNSSVIAQQAQNVEGNTKAAQKARAAGQKLASTTENKDSSSRQVEKQTKKATKALYKANSQSAQEAGDTALKQVIREEVKNSGLAEKYIDDAVNAIYKRFQTGQSLTPAESRAANKISDAKTVMDTVLNRYAKGDTQKIAKDIATKARASTERVFDIADEAQTMRNVDGQKQTAGGTKISDDGRDISSTGDVVNVVGLASAEITKNKNGTKSVDMTYLLDDGSTISAKDASLGSFGKAVVYEGIAKMGLTSSTANRLIRGYQTHSNTMTGIEYLAAVKEAYLAGYTGIENSGKGLMSSLTEDTRNDAIAAGKQDADNETTSQEDRVKASQDKYTELFGDTGEIKRGGVYKLAAGRHSIITKKSVREFTDDQQAQIKVLQKIAKNITHSNIYIFESELVDGKRVLSETIFDEDGFRKGDAADNGFIRSNGDIYIDLYAGRDGDGVILWTAAHELTHFLHDYNNKAFRELATFLASQYGSDTLKALTDAKARNYGLSYRAALEEVVADSMQQMFTDPDARIVMDQLMAQNKNLAVKIADLLNKFADKLDAIYGTLAAETTEAAIVKQMSKDVRQTIARMYGEGLITAGNNYSVADTGKGNTQQIDNTHSVTVAMAVEKTKGAKIEGGQPLFKKMYRAMETDYFGYRQMLVKAGVDSATINSLFSTIDKVMDKVKDNLHILDYDWEKDVDDRGFNPVKPNSDSLYKFSVDFSTLCRKRILQQAIQMQLQERLDRALTREESIAIRDELMKIQEEGRQIEIACALCYVESARMKSPVQINKFLDNRRQIITDYFANKDAGTTKEKKEKAERMAREELGRKWRTPEEQKKYKAQIAAGTYKDPSVTTMTAKGKRKFSTTLKQMPGEYAAQIRDAKKSVNADYVLTEEEKKLLDVADTMSASSFTSPEGLDSLVKNYPRLFDAYTSFVRNATKSKGLEKDVWWRIGDSNAISDDLIAAMNKENGLRSQSWSDYQVIHTLDYIAAIVELSARGAKMQAYTKVPGYVKLMGRTGQMINLSLIPTATFNGTLEYDGVEGMPIKTALKLRKAYPETVGTICIGIDDNQIKLMLASKDIDYVIPYHHSGMSKVLRKAMHIPTWKSYQDYQEEKNLSRDEAVAAAKARNVKLLSEDDDLWHKKTKFSDWYDYKQAAETARWYNAKAENGNLTAEEQKLYKQYGAMFGGYMAMHEAAETYKDICAERGLKVKFDMFENEQNYWKLLIDRKMVNQVTGAVIEQKAVQPIFNEKDILDILNEEIKKYPGVSADEDYATRTVYKKFINGEMNEKIQAINAITGAVNTAVDNVTKVSILNSSEETRKSSRVTQEENDEYMELAKDPEKNAGRLQQLVDKAAKAAGYKTELYHGTTEHFYVFNKGEEGIHLGTETVANYVADEKARIKSRRENKTDAEKIVLKLFTNIKKPALFNVDLCEWSPANIAWALQCKIDGRDNDLVPFETVHPEDISFNVFDMEKTRALIEQSNKVYGDTEAEWNILEQIFKTNGYDSIQYKNKYEADKKSISYIVLNENQVKLADPVTYDDAGNVIPLSERFNEKKDDIRFSSREYFDNEDFKKLAGENELIEALHQTILAARNTYSTRFFDNLYKERPDLDYVERLQQNDKAAADELRKLVAKINDARAIHDFRWFVSDGHRDTYDANTYSYISYKKTHMRGLKQFRTICDVREAEIRNVGGRNLNVKAGRQYSVQEIKALFDELNTNAEIQALGDKIFAMADILKISYQFGQSKMEKAAGWYHGNASRTTDRKGLIAFNRKFMNDVNRTDQRKADTLLHETIHSLTAIDLTALTQTYDWFEINADTLNATSFIVKTYEAMKKTRSFKFREMYGMTDEKEFIAELANPDFRAALLEAVKDDRALNEYTEVVKAHAKRLGVSGSKSIVENLTIALDFFIDNFNADHYYAMADRRRYNTTTENYYRYSAREQSRIVGNDGRTYAAMHKLSLNALYKWVDRDFTLVNPSVGITDVDNPYQAFGDVAIVFKSNTFNVDDENFPVYSGDAFSNSFPPSAFFPDIYAMSDFIDEKYGEDALSAETKWNILSAIENLPVTAKGRNVSRTTDSIKDIAILRDSYGWQKKMYDSLSEELTTLYQLDRGSKKKPTQKTHIKNEYHDFYETNLTDDFTEWLEAFIDDWYTSEAVFDMRTDLSSLYRTRDGFIDPYDFDKISESMRENTETLDRHAKMLGGSNRMNSEQLNASEARDNLAKRKGGAYSGYYEIASQKSINDGYSFVLAPNTIDAEYKNMIEKWSGIPVFTYEYEKGNQEQNDQRYADAIKEIFAGDTGNDTRFSKRLFSSQDMSMLRAAAKTGEKIDKLTAQNKDLKAQNKALQKESTAGAKSFYRMAFDFIETAKQSKEYKPHADWLNKYQEALTAVNKTQTELETARRTVRMLTASGGNTDALTAAKNNVTTLTNKLNRQKATLEKRGQAQPVQAVLADAIKQREADMQRRFTEQRQADAQELQDTKRHYQEARKKAMDKRHASANREKIRTLLNDFNQRLVRPTEGHYIPRSMKGVVADLLNAVEFATPGTNLHDKLSSFKIVYDEILNNPEENIYHDQVISDAITDTIRAIGNTEFNDLNAYQTEILYNTMKAIDHTIRNAVTIRGITTEMNAFDFAKKMISETNSVSKARVGVMSRYLQMQLRPQAMFARLGNHIKNSAWSQLYRLLDDGQLKQTRLLMEGQMMFADVFAKQNRKDLLALSDTDNLVDIGLEGRDGNPVMITRGMMLSVYRALLNEDNARHIMYGGYTVPSMTEYYKAGKDPYGVNSTRTRPQVQAIQDAERILATAKKEQRDLIHERVQLRETMKETAKTDGKNSITYIQQQQQLDDLDTRISDYDTAIQQYTADVNTQEALLGDYIEDMKEKILDMMTPFEARLMTTAEDFFDVWSKNVLNATTLEEYGFEKAQVKNYMPIHTDKKFLGASFEQIARDMSLENVGFMKSRIHGTNPIMLEDFTDVINRQIKNVSQYAGMMPAIRQFNRIYGKNTSGYETSVQAAVNDKYGKYGLQYVDDLMSDLVGARAKQSTFFDKARGHMAQAVLSLNPRVAFAQAASYPTAAAVVGWRPLMKALAKGGKDGRVISRADQDLIAKYSPLLWYRMQGYSTQELGDAKNAAQLRKKVDGKMKFVMGWINAFDGGTVGRLWSAAEYYVQENNSDLQKGTDEYYEQVAKVFNDVVEKTQPNYSTMQRPDILRNTDSIVKQLTMFMTQRLQNFNILYDSAATLKQYKKDYEAGLNGVTEEDVKNARTDVIRAVTSQMFAACTIVAMKGITDVFLHSVNGYRDDDEELTTESVSLRLIDNLLDCIISGTLGGSEAYSLLKALLLKQSYYSPELNGVQAYFDIAVDIVNIAQAEWSEGVPTDKIYALAEALCNLAGIPLGNAKKIAHASVYWIEDAVNGEFGSFEAGVKRTTAQKGNILYNAYLSGDEDKIAKYEGILGEDKAQTAVSSRTKTAYQKGKIDEDEAARRLTEYAGKDDDDAYWTIEKWDYDKDKKEGDADFNKYSDWTAALETGDGVTDLVKEYTAHGVTKNALHDKVTDYWRSEYVNASTSRKLQILAIVKKEMAACGYTIKTDKDNKMRTNDDGWPIWTTK